MWDDVIGEIPIVLGLFGIYRGKSYSSLSYWIYTIDKPPNYGDYWIVDTSFYKKIFKNCTITFTTDNLFDRECDSAGLTSATDISGNPDMFGVRLGDPRTISIRYPYEF